MDSFNIPNREDQILFENWAALVLNLFALRNRRIKKLKLQIALENMFIYQFQFRQTEYQNPVFLAIQFLDTLYLLLSVPLKAWQRKAKQKWN